MDESKSLDVEMIDEPDQHENNVSDLHQNEIIESIEVKNEKELADNCINNKYIYELENTKLYHSPIIIFTIFYLIFNFYVINSLIFNDFYLLQANFNYKSKRIFIL